MFLLRASAISLLGLAGLYAQSNLDQQISGQVTDASGAVLRGATVTATDQNTGLVRTVKSNQDGNYVVPNLPVGAYRVTCEAPGFRKEIVANNRLATNINIEVNCRMEVGSQAESVTVQADAMVIELNKATSGLRSPESRPANCSSMAGTFPSCYSFCPACRPRTRTASASSAATDSTTAASRSTADEPTRQPGT